MLRKRPISNSSIYKQKKIELKQHSEIDGRKVIKELRVKLCGMLWLYVLIELSSQTLSRQNIANLCSLRSFVLWTLLDFATVPGSNSNPCMRWQGPSSLVWLNWESNGKINNVLKAILLLNSKQILEIRWKKINNLVGKWCSVEVKILYAKGRS